MLKRLLIAWLSVFGIWAIFCAQPAHPREVVPALDGLTGGTSGKLDGVAVNTASGVSTLGSLAITRDASGGRIYIHELVGTGGAESSPHLIIPDDSAAGDTRWKCVADLNAGTSIWQTVLSTLDDLPETGTSKTVSASEKALWNAVLNGSTTYYFNGVTQPVQLTLNQVQELLGVSQYLTGVSADVQSQINTVRGTADKAYAWGDHSAANYFDKDTNTLDDVPEGSSYKRIPAATKTQVDNLLAGNSTYYTGVTDDAQTQINKKQDQGPNLSGVSSPGTWKVWYTNGSGLVTEVALGADGTYLKSTGAAAAPTFDTPSTGGGGSGATRFRAPDGTDAEAAAVGSAPSGIFVIGQQGISGTASGNTLFLTADAIHSMVSSFVAALMRSYLAAAAFTGATDYAVDSQVTDFVRGLFASYLAAAAFTGDTGFALASALATYTSLAQLHTVSGFAYDSGVSAHVRALLEAYLGTGAVAGASLAQVYALQTGLAAAGAEKTTTGVSVVQKLLGVTPYASDGTSGLAGVTNLHLQGSKSGVSVSVAGESVYITAPWKIGYAWDYTAHSPGMSDASGVSTGPIQIDADVGVSGIVCSSRYGGPASGVSITIFYSTSGPPNSGNTLGVHEKAYNVNQTSYNYSSGVSNLAKGSWIAFAPSGSPTGITGVSNLVVIIYGRTKADGGQ